MRVAEGFAKRGWMPPTTTPHFVDLYVGARLRGRRRSLGLSQAHVAKAAGVTFPQLQKYERGANRISASKLYALAAVLRCGVAWFFEGLPDTAPDASAASAPGNGWGRTVYPLLMHPEGLALVRAFQPLPPNCKAQVLALVRALVDEGS
ncbi:helix-turn-helix domain-containing protein [Caulobacter sp. RHG1]|uniref:helix-turn-helix domain-containing protein n=1 Tax=Caulobacter sp. (strain RHG1) TaxID=2545762 RepID=UPI001F50DA8B|nr:helix-turn-helix domain-containing protein [Caulobacter sp. RHG1]NQE65320.1 Transcriptional regulator, Xre family [Caulobacter sp. RHG1]